MTDKGHAFSKEVGNDLFRILRERARCDLPELSDQDRLTAMLSAALIPVANVLRDPIEWGINIDTLLNFCSKWLRELLEPVEASG